MKRGPKPKQNRDSGAASRPQMPDYLNKLPAAQDIWFEEIERVVAHGVNADHSSTFATYCVIEASMRQSALSGQLPTGNLWTERRKLAEMLGIGGLAGRTSGGTAANPLQADSNAFAGLPDA